MIQGCYDCQNKWMYLLPFCFPATIFITLHSSSEQVLPTLYFQPMQLSSLVMIMYRWLDLFIASWHLFFFFFNFCLILVQTASVQTPQKLHYSVQNLLWSAEDRSAIIAQIDVSFCNMLSQATQAEGSWGPFVKQNKSQSSEKTFLLMPATLEMKTIDQHGEDWQLLIALVDFEG